MSGKLTTWYWILMLPVNQAEKIILDLAVCIPPLAKSDFIAEFD